MADVFEDREDLIAPRRLLWGVIEDTPWLDWLLLTKRPQNVFKMIPWKSHWPQNVWLGTTVENQRMAEKRVPVLLKYPATIRFVSCEPLLGPVDLTRWLHNGKGNYKIRALEHPYRSSNNGIDWAIAGGESGPHGRPVDPSWIRSIRDQCLDSDIPFNFKQWGNWRPIRNSSAERSKVIHLKSGTGQIIKLGKMGKKRAGRVLDRRTWDEVPLGKCFIAT